MSGKFIGVSCPSCNGKDVIQNSSNRYTCKICGTNFFYDKDQIYANVGSAEIDLFRKGIGNLKVGNYHLAEQAFKTMTAEYPLNYKGWVGCFLCEFRRKPGQEAIDTLKRRLEQIGAPAHVRMGLNLDSFSVIDWAAIDGTRRQIAEQKKDKEAAAAQWETDLQRTKSEIADKSGAILRLQKQIKRIKRKRRFEWIEFMFSYSFFTVPAFPLCYFILLKLFRWNRWYIPALLWTAYMLWLMRADIREAYAKKTRQITDLKNQKENLYQKLYSLEESERLHSDENERRRTLGVFDAEVEELERTISELNPNGTTTEEYENQVEAVIRRCMVVLEGEAA